MDAVNSDIQVKIETNYVDYFTIYIPKSVEAGSEGSSTPAVQSPLQSFP